jgi:hypothetical protein
VLPPPARKRRAQRGALKQCCDANETIFVSREDILKPTRGLINTDQTAGSEPTLCCVGDGGRRSVQQQTETIMSKHDEKLAQKSPAKPESVTIELSDEQLREISGGSITRTTDAASPLLFQMACSGTVFNKGGQS